MDLLCCVVEQVKNLLMYALELHLTAIALFVYVFLLLFDKMFV